MSLKYNDPYSMATHGLVNNASFKTVNVIMIGEGELSKPVGINVVKTFDNFEITATSTEFYEFIGWDEYPYEETNTLLLENVSENLTVTARFLRKYYFEYDIMGDGTIEFTPNLNSGDQIYINSVIKAVAIPGDGYKFNIFSTNRDINYDENSISLRITNDTMLFCRFSKIVYNIEAYVLGNGTLEITDNNGGKYNHGDLINFIATPDDGWQFSEWKYDFNDEYTNEILYHELISDLKVVPVFTEIV